MNVSSDGSSTVLLFPGQGSQYKGMGKEIWRKFPDITTAASDILGYSIVDLCVNDSDLLLKNTRYTQPALYVLQVLYYLRWKSQHDSVPYAAIGHSVGEYAALFSAGCFDFETGLYLVQKRGRLMSEAAADGAMTAVIGLPIAELKVILQNKAFSAIDVANYNSPLQTVISGKIDDLVAIEEYFKHNQIRYVRLRVSAAFHSRHMMQAKCVFSQYLRQFYLQSPQFTVISNVTAKPYKDGDVASLLGEQITAPVRWEESVRLVMSHRDVQFVEMGIDDDNKNRAILTKLVDDISIDDAQTTKGWHENNSPELAQSLHLMPEVLLSPSQQLGSIHFRERYHLKYAYVAGAMYRGVSSPEMVIRLGNAGLLGILGAGGLSLIDIERGLQHIKRALSSTTAYGVSLLADYAHPEHERDNIELYMKYQVSIIEAAAFMSITPALALFRIKGLKRDVSGKIRCHNRILAKVSRLEVAQAFMAPVPEEIVALLLQEGAISREQSELAALVPVSHDICVEADSGGHTDGGNPLVLLPAMQQLRNHLSQKMGYAENICVGLAGGIGTPLAVASVFSLGADFILTGSINQCSVEAGATETVKTLLQDVGIHDTAYAPAGDMFETGAKVQVLKKGILFPMRASKLYSLYTLYPSLEALPYNEQRDLEKNIFKKDAASVWDEIQRYLQRTEQYDALRKAEGNPKIKMARMFRWYFHFSMLQTFSNSIDNIRDYQIHTGPALGAFNALVKDTQFARWESRHVDEMAFFLLHEAVKQNS